MSEASSKALKLTRASTVTATAITWLHDQLIPLKTLTVVSGNSGIGKTTIILLFLAQVTRGLLPGAFFGYPRAVLVMSPEDDPGAITRPRLEAVGADLDLVHFVSATRPTPEGTVETIVSFPEDLPLLREAIRATNPAVVMLDPIASLISGNLDKREDVRAAFDSLASLANASELSVILIAHNKKSMDSVRAKISGSSAITDAARSVLALAKDEDTDQVILSVNKASYSTAEGLNYAYALESVEVALPDGSTTTVARAVYVGESAVSVADLLSRGLDNEDDTEDRNAAQAFILAHLKTCDGWEAPAGAVLKAGRAAGFTDNEIKHARQRSKNPKIKTLKSGFGPGWVWGIQSEDASEGAGGARLHNTAPPAPSLKTVASSPPAGPPAPTVSEFPAPAHLIGFHELGDTA